MLALDLKRICLGSRRRNRYDHLVPVTGDPHSTHELIGTILIIIETTFNLVCCTTRDTVGLRALETINSNIIREVLRND